MVRWARTEAGLTQSDPRKRLGVSQPRIARLNSRRQPAARDTRGLGRALNLRLELAFPPPL
jgi:predicted transcriptional regulator